jgi:ABC-2 type transport system permease protein
MKKFWLVCKHEYLRHVLRKRFIMALLSVPIFMVVIVGVGILAVVLGSDSRPVGYVDQSGLFTNAQVPPNTGRSITPKTQQIRFDNQGSAEEALANKEIQGIFLIAPDYWETGNVILIADTALDSSVTWDFRKFILYNLLTSEPGNLRQRLVNGPEIVIRTVDDVRQLDSSNPLTFLIPVFSGILFMIAINTSGGYLMQAVVEEKENRTMEIVLTSVSTDQLMAGKIFGNLSVGLTQLAIWLLAAAGGIIFALNYFPEFANFGLDTTFVWVLLATFLPAFIMVAALMAMIGATTTETREAQQISALFTIPIAIPFWFMGLIITNPNSPVAVGLSLFPLTAPVTLPMRVMLTNLQFWEVGLPVGLLIIFAAGAIWLASRAFRLGLLRYGKKLSLREIFQKA